MSGADGPAESTNLDAFDDQPNNQSPACPDPNATLNSLALSVSPLTSGSVKEPQIIGPYCLLRRLGEGGMGQVWLAQQTEPVRRMVALKLIKIGMYNDDILQRFRS